jgi:hypothetical protein
MGDMKGLLWVGGTIDLSQFWPNGDSDVDTANVVVDADGFQFSEDASPQGFRRTHVFEDAFIGQKAVIGNGRKVTVRIQGIDAPELHCPPGAQHPKAPKQDAPASAKKKKKVPPLKGNGGKFRQFQGRHRRPAWLLRWARPRCRARSPRASTIRTTSSTRMAA